MSTTMHGHRRTRRAAGITLTTFAAAVAVGGSAALAQSPSAGEPLDLAYLSFAVANSYDAPMQAAAEAAAAAGGAKLTIFDANNDPPPRPSSSRTRWRRASTRASCSSPSMARGS